MGNLPSINIEKTESIYENNKNQKINNPIKVETTALINSPDSPVLSPALSLSSNERKEKNKKITRFSDNESTPLTVSNVSYKIHDHNIGGIEKTYAILSTILISCCFVLGYGWHTISSKLLGEYYLIDAPGFLIMGYGLGFPFTAVAYMCAPNDQETNRLAWTSPVYIANIACATFNIVFTVISMTLLPGYIVATIKSSSMVITFLEYRFLHGHIYSWGDIFAAILIAVANVLLLIGSLQMGEGYTKSRSSIQTFVGFTFALLASVAQALKKTYIKIIACHNDSFKAMAEGATLNLISVSICGFLTGMINNAILGQSIAAFLKHINDVCASGPVGFLYLASLPVCGSFMFLFQWLIVRNTSATSSQVLTNFRRTLCVLIFILVLGENFNTITIISVTLSIAGMSVYTWSGWMNSNH